MCAERADGKLCQLEALSSEGNADDRDREQDACCHASDAELPTEQDEPDEIGDRVRRKVRGDGMSHRPEEQICDLEALQTEGDADDGDAEDEARDRP